MSRVLLPVTPDGVPFAPLRYAPPLGGRSEVA
jgi:hypothetical protein